MMSGSNDTTGNFHSAASGAGSEPISLAAAWRAHLTNFVKFGDNAAIEKWVELIAVPLAKNDSEILREIITGPLKDYSGFNLFIYACDSGNDKLATELLPFMTPDDLGIVQFGETALGIGLKNKKLETATSVSVINKMKPEDLLTGQLFCCAVGHGSVQDVKAILARADAEKIDFEELFGIVATNPGEYVADADQEQIVLALIDAVPLSRTYVFDALGYGPKGADPVIEHAEITSAIKAKILSSAEVVGFENAIEDPSSLNSLKMAALLTAAAPAQAPSPM